MLTLTNAHLLSVNVSKCILKHNDKEFSFQNNKNVYHQANIQVGRNSL